MANISITGHIIEGPETTTIKNKTVCNFVISGREKDAEMSEHHFFKCAASGKLAETISETAQIGMELYLTGTYDTERFSDSENNPIYDNRITVDGFFNSDTTRVSA